MADPDFLQSVIAGLPGVDPNSEDIQVSVLLTHRFFWGNLGGQRC